MLLLRKQFAKSGRDSFSMSLSAFVPANTQKARVTAISAFGRMLELEGVSMEFLHASILMDTSDKRLAATMDRFGYFLATHEGKKGKLARNSTSSYYRNVKLWLFDEYPHLRVATELILLNQGKILDKHCLKRENGGLTNKAPPYGVVYLRLLRVKTSEEQGLTLVPDKNNFLTCPLLTLAVALATQDAPCASLLSQLPEQQPQADAPLDSGVPLHDLLAADPGSLEVAVVPAPTPPPAPTQPASTKQKKARTTATTRGEDSMQGHVNRMLKRVALPAGVTSELTSHSFRRGGAQHANGDDCLAAQWIFDRGAQHPHLIKIKTKYNLKTQPQDTTPTCQGSSHILAVIDELISSNRLLAARLTIVEAALLKSKKKQATTGEDQAQDALEQEQLPEPKPKRRKKPATNLSATWYEWYTKVPPVWNCDDRQKKSEYRHVVPS
ncbi:unnamed protein product [Phytophthora fragariaefolia]|uniref:Unnamed protein product n=1 Tax=Phytophthora fragariaefolia TaxID=1490495 RepID=A0A9W6X3B0_9STRA|nr:unnamed protein product [Phytophthora fragariaefolia]